MTEQRRQQAKRKKRKLRKGRVFGVFFLAILLALGDIFISNTRRGIISRQKKINKKLNLKEILRLIMLKIFY